MGSWPKLDLWLRRNESECRNSRVAPKHMNMPPNHHLNKQGEKKWGGEDSTAVGYLPTRKPFQASIIIFMLITKFSVALYMNNLGSDPDTE